MSLFGIKLPLVCWQLLLTGMALVTGWSWLESFSLVFAWWEVCLLVSHQIDLSCFGVTYNLLDVLCNYFWCLHLLCKLPNLACKELVKINTTAIAGFRHKLFIFQEKQKMSQCKMFAVACGYLARHTWACTSLYHSSADLLPWQKLVSRSTLLTLHLLWAYKILHI